MLLLIENLQRVDPDYYEKSRVQNPDDTLPNARDIPKTISGKMLFGAVMANSFFR